VGTKTGLLDNRAVYDDKHLSWQDRFIRH